MEKMLIFVGSLIIGFTISFLFLTQINQPLPTTPKKLSGSTNTPFSVEQPPTQSLKGVISDMSGNVEFLSRTATQPASLSPLHRVQQGEEIFTREDGHLTFSVASTCIVELLPETHLIVTQTLPDGLVFELPAGEIVLTKKCSFPLSVRSMHLLIDHEQGTLEVTADAETRTVEAALREGTSTVAFNNSENISTILKLMDAQTLLYDDATRNTQIE